MRIIMVLLTFLSACSTLPGMNEDELTSVIYHMKATVPGHSKTVTAERTDKGYLLTYHKEDMEHPEKIEIDEADFKKLENWLLRMKKQGRKKKTDGDEWVETLEVNYLSKGKPTTKRYETTHYLDKKSYQLKEDAITLMFELIDRYCRQFEIRIYYSKGIATPTEIYTCVEPADLVEDLGSFLEKRDSGSDMQTGGRNDYSYRWRAVKPGIVKVWLEELKNDYDPENLPIEFKPYSSYEIDEDLMVKRVEEN